MILNKVISKFVDKAINKLGFRIVRKDRIGLRYIKDIDSGCSICVDLIFRYKGKSVFKMHSFSDGLVLWDSELNYVELFLFSIRLYLMDKLFRRINTGV